MIETKKGKKMKITVWWEGSLSFGLKELNQYKMTLKYKFIFCLELSDVMIIRDSDSVGHWTSSGTPTVWGAAKEVLES